MGGGGAPAPSLIAKVCILCRGDLERINKDDLLSSSDLQRLFFFLIYKLCRPSLANIVFKLSKL